MRISPSYLLALALTACRGDPFVAGELIELNDNGAWSWFMDERVRVHDNKLIVGSVRAVRGFRTGEPDADWGNVEVAVHDLETGSVGTQILFRHFEQDDHNNPSFLPLADGSMLALYTKHKREQYIYAQRSESADLLRWSDPDLIVSPKSSSGANTTTYSNLFRLPSGRIANFYRGLDQDPNYMYSDDEGATWTYAGRLMHGEDGYSPYLKYAQDSEGAIHFVATEDHPRQFDNSLYHGVLAGDQLRRSDGETIAVIGGSAAVNVRTWDFTRVFAGDPDNVGWMTDIEVDADDRPIIAFSVQVDGRDKPQFQGGIDMRYHYGRWDGAGWATHEMAYAGHRLYAGEDDYSGLATIDPQDTRVVFISTSADPVDGFALISDSDGERHHELFRGVTDDLGETWEWEAITRDSDCDNLRPLVPRWDDERTALVWMRGTYLRNHGDWTTAVVGLILE